VTSDSGDVWLASVNPAAPFSPLALGPGQTGTIHVTITPSAPSGTHVNGFVDVDTFNLDTDSGDQVASLPYHYTVG
jgi:hypothetical protein